MISSEARQYACTILSRQKTEDESAYHNISIEVLRKGASSGAQLKRGELLEKVNQLQEAIYFLRDV